MIKLLSQQYSEIREIMKYKVQIKHRTNSIHADVCDFAKCRCAAIR